MKTYKCNYFLLFLFFLNVSLLSCSGSGGGGGGSPNVSSAPIINSLNQNSMMPFGLLTVSGSGFDPTANTLVRFSNDAGFHLDVPPVSIGPNAINVSVPPYINPNSVASWTTQAPMPVAEFRPAAGVVNGILYIAGGNDGSPTSTLQAYNPATSTWSTLASMPGVRDGGNGAEVINGRLYVAGGWTISPPLPNNNLWVYDPPSNTWSSKTNMPILSACGVTGVINGQLYVYTPCDGFSGNRGYLYLYDPPSDTWTSKTGPSNTPVHVYGTGGIINGKFFLAGGSDSSGNFLTTLDVYDPTTNAWTSLAPMSTGRVNMAGAVLGGKLYVLGGRTQAGAVLNLVEVYDPVTNTWTTQNPMPTAREGLVAGAINGILYAVGGSNGGSGPLTTSEALTLGKVFSSGTVKVQIVQTSGTATVSSNTIPGLQIQDLPAAPSTPAGTITLGFVQGAISFANQLQTQIKGSTLDTPTMNAAITAQITNLQTLASGINSIVLNPSLKFTLGNVAGNPITIGASNLLDADRMIIAILLAQGGGSGGTGTSAGIFNSLFFVSLALAQSTTGCQSQEAVSLTTAIESGNVASWSGYYNAPITSPLCKTADAFNTAYEVIGGAGAVALGIGIVVGAPPIALALPSAMLLYATIEGAGGMIAIGGVLGQSTDGARQLVRGGIAKIQELQLAAFKALLPLLGTTAEELGALGAIALGAKTVFDAISPPTAFTLSIGKAGAGTGTVTANPPCCNYSSGTVVTLSAVPDSGSTFSGWSGDCSGSGSCVITMDNNKNVTANFSKSGGIQTWQFNFSGNLVTITVDSTGNFSGVGTGTVPGCSFPINFSGKMVGTSMTISLSASGCSESESGQGSGTLDAAFPNAKSGAGTLSGTISDPLGTRGFTISFTATFISTK